MGPSDAALMEIVEEVGLLFERYGVPRMVGRVLGWLMVCDPPEQSAADLARALQASKASISTSTRLLEQTGIIERLARPGVRPVYFRLRPEAAGTALIRERLRAVTLFRGLIERALQALEDAPPHRRARLKALHMLYTFFERELDAMLQRWDTGRGKL